VFHNSSFPETPLIKESLDRLPRETKDFNSIGISPEGTPIIIESKIKILRDKRDSSATYLLNE